MLFKPADNKIIIIFPKYLKVSIYILIISQITDASGHKYTHNKSRVETHYKRFFSNSILIEYSLSHYFYYYYYIFINYTTTNH